MPLDSQTYLRNNGWQGHGTALREGALARPLSIPQKRTLAGVGKDRDEAFPFWDHVFAAASSAIQIKVGSDDEASDSESTPVPSLRRTTTGIISNKRPPTGTPVDHSSSTTPEPSHPQSVMTIAKRAAARRNLYSRFFKGPVLGPDATEKEMVQTEKMSMEEKVHAGHEDMRDALEHAHVVHHVEGHTKKEVQERKKKRKRDEEKGEAHDGKEEGKEKRRSKEEKEQQRAEKAQKKAEKEARRATKALASTSTAASASTHKKTSAEPEAPASTDDAKTAKRRAREERRKVRPEVDGLADRDIDEKAKRRAEKKAKRLEKELEESANAEDQTRKADSITSCLEAETARRKKRRREVVDETALSPLDGDTEKEGKKKKRRRESST